jgi:hypothetical protein
MGKSVFPGLVDLEDETHRYKSLELGSNTFDTFNDVEDIVLWEIGKNEWGAQTCLGIKSCFKKKGTWTKVRRDGMRSLERLCTYSHDSKCPWRVKIWHNTLTGKYFIFLPLFEHDKSLHEVVANERGTHRSVWHKSVVSHDTMVS